MRLTRGGVLAELLGAEEALVSSLHSQSIDRLASGLRVEATAPDGLIEAVSVHGARRFAVGVPWHAEWRFCDSPLSQALWTALGAAARERAEARS